MSQFVPFKAYRPVDDLVEEVSCKPYDVVNTSQAREESNGNANSFYRVIKPEIEFPDGHDPFAPEVYEKGKSNLNQLIDAGVLVQEEVESYYIYELTMGEHVQTGLVGCCSIDDYFNEVIKKHELTKPKVEADRRKHITISQFNYEPVFFSYHNVSTIDTMVNQGKNGDPIYDFVSGDGIRHRLWQVSDSAVIDQIQTAFRENVPVIYIADGHHRTAAGASAGRELRASANGNGAHRFNYFMCVLFPEDQVRIMDYNRVVKDLNGLTSGEFIQKLEEAFLVEKQEGQYQPEEHTNIGMYIDGSWYKLSAREGTYDPSDAIGKLGFTILSNNILEPLLNIVDLRRDERIDFIGGIHGLNELERQVEEEGMAAAFAMHPIDMGQLMEISDSGRIMPPKVTWFEPKLRSGLFVHQLNGN